MVDVSREPPRLLYAVPTPRPVHRLIQQTQAPMRMSSNVQGSPSTAGRNPPANTTTPSSTAPSTPSSNPTPNPQSNPQLQQPMPPGVPPMFMMSGSPMSFIINASPHGPQPASRMPVAQPTARPSGTPGPSPAPPNAAPSAPAGPPRTPRPPGPPMMMGGIPIMMPPTGHVDPHLPCQSRHFLLRRANQAANAGTAQDAAEPAMTNIIQNVMSSMFGQGVTMQGRPSSAAAPVGSENPAMAHLRHMLSQANPNAAMSSSATSSTQSAPSEAQGAPNATQNATQTGHLTDDMFTQLVSGIGSFVSRAASGQPTNVTLADFLNELGQGQGVSTGDGLLTEIFNAVSTELTFIDLLTIFLGNAAPLSNARGSLRAFVNERVLQGQTNTQEHMAAGIDRLIEELQPDITAISNESNVKDDIDFGRTLVRFTRAHLTTLCEMVVRTEVNDETFANDLVAAVKRAIHEFIVLCRSCLEGDVSALDALIQARVRSWTGEINPLIQQWMISNSSQQLSQIMPTITVTNADVVGYIVKREAVSQASSEASYMSAESGEDRAKEAEGMDVEEASKPPPMDATLLSRLPLPPRRDEMDVGIEAVGSADWHRVVPSEWVPVISRDVARQQRDSAQPPFSDAYLNGMPAKRRKLMSQSESELSNLPAVLPEALKRAATSVGAQSLTSLEDMAKEASSSSELINTFQTEVNNTLANRVAKDPDYIPEKYPHCEQVYKKSD
ncbi:hypothetical protein CAPTEDRAFT_225947 [Capitella teleta]|uniref:Large proline-rich protein BAG6 domain-containing protein n=1 Tax=Capitella teleta TaxID=283909 RepID=R7TBW1_CAPTE|nr:hypothetical protein CAPTEDRAFT_225947 [Capitella teleta]|eukprot:ELT91208.1 hypothetical protein CAPTEDRAFT_225947 [Capitella teleta]